jgi:hypothetical protein
MKRLFAPQHAPGYRRHLHLLFAGSLFWLLTRFRSPFAELLLASSYLLIVFG